MAKSTRQAKQAAKARLSGAIASKSNTPKNKKIVFGDDNGGGDFFDDGVQTQNNGDSEDEENVDNSAGEGGSDGEDKNDKSDSDHDDDEDAVEEVKGGTARESTLKLREAERKTAKESVIKKKRKKKNDVVQKVVAVEKNESSESEDESEEGGDLLTDDFFKMVDTERTDQLQQTKKEKKHKKTQQKKKLGKHTTFVVEDEYKMSDAHKMGQNIEVVAIGGGESTESSGIFDEEQQLLLSATLGSAPSKAATAFARGSMARGKSKERGSDSRKRKSKDDDTWKRSKRLNRFAGSRPGQAPALFVSKK